MQNLRTAVVRFNYRPGDKTAHLATTKSFVEDAADVIGIPEMR